MRTPARPLLLLVLLPSLLAHRAAADAFASPTDHARLCLGSPPAPECRDKLKTFMWCNTSARHQAYCGKLPDFFAARGRQTEAKIGLAGWATSEKLFRVTRGTFTTDLAELEQPARTAAPGRYVYGIPFACAKGRRKTTLDLAGGNLAAEILADRARITAAFERPPAGGCPDFQTKFVVMAVGRPVSGAELDVWTIDEAKALVNVSSPVKPPVF